MRVSVAAAARPSTIGRPSRPFGRTASTSAMTANASTNVACGIRTMPNACSSPISTAARYAPITLPSPPITTTTNASVIAPRSICKLAERSGSASAPPKAASAAPSANTVVNNRRWSTPKAPTISRSCVAARTSVPQRVRENSSQSSTRTTGPAPISARS